MQKVLKKIHKLPPPIKWLALVIGLLISLAILTAPEPKPVDYKAVSFETSSDSRIYFHNIRSYYYDIDRFSKKPMEIYRLKRRTKADDKERINFDIIRAAGMEQAFIYTNVGAKFRECDSLSLAFEMYPLEKSLQLLNSEDHFEIAAMVYTSLLSKKSIYLLCQSDTFKELYLDKAAQLDAEITLEDYFRLVLKNWMIGNFNLIKQLI